MAGQYMTPNSLSSTSFVNNSTIYGHFSPPYPVSPLDARFPQPPASTSRQPSSGQENTPEAVLNYPIYQSSVDLDRLLHQTEAENSRLHQRLLVLETEKLNLANNEKYNAVEKGKRLPNIVRHLAHGFAFSKLLWVQEKASIICKSRLPADFDPSTRYSLKPATPEASRAHALNVFLWELEQYLPKEFKHYLTNEKIMETFLKQMQTCRSDLQNLVRTNAALLLSEFEHLLPSDSEDVIDAERREANTRLKGLLAYDANATIPYPLVAPVIDQGGVDGLFKTDNIRKFLVMILFGKAQLSAKSGIPTITKGCNADNWKVTAVTPNMVAVAATMMRYMISPDRAFTTVGTTSKIDWLAAYSQYRNGLVVDASSPAITSLIENLNGQLFGGQQSRPRHSPLPITLEDNSLQLAIASLHAASVGHSTSPSSASMSSSAHDHNASSTAAVSASFLPSRSLSLFPAPSASALPSSNANPPTHHPTPSAYTQPSNLYSQPSTNNIATDRSETENDFEQEQEDEELTALLEETIAKQASGDSTPSANIAASSAPIRHPLAPVSVPSTSNLDILVAAAISADPIIPATNRRPVRGALKRSYLDLDENGEPEADDGPTPKKRALGSGAAGQQTRTRANANRNRSAKPKKTRK